MSQTTRNILRIICFAAYLSVLAAQSILVAVVFHLICRCIYIGYVSLALRAQMNTAYFTRKYGKEAGFWKFQSIASFVMNNDGLSFGILSIATWNTLPGTFLPEWAWVTLGLILTTIGVGFKLWAKSTLEGAGGYFWKDFFVSKADANYIPTGPYRFFKNPMYTIGDCHLYGIPMTLLSWPGLVFGGLFDHLSIYFLYRWVEKPHADKLYGGIAAEKKRMLDQEGNLMQVTTLEECPTAVLTQRPGSVDEASGTVS